MGIKGLWDIIGDCVEVVPLAQLGRPLRIAVDEAGWRFNNLTPKQVEDIQKKEPAARPIEKAIMHRLVGLMQLNIQVMFVFDGPQRPWKRERRGGGKVDWERIQEIRALCRQLGIVQHFARGEAEAECAKLQYEGVVDAVWTDDGDAFMFGTTMLIRSHYEEKGTKDKAAKSKTHVDVYHAKDILEKHGLDRDGFVLFALLAGGDYDLAGLKDCGPVKAMQMVRQGLAQRLRVLSKENLHIWRQQLENALKGSPEVPSDFPKQMALEHYIEPTVSTSEKLAELKSLGEAWNKPLVEDQLRPFFRAHYNIQIVGYLKHILPILLTRTLAATPIGQEHTNNIYKIELIKIRQKKGADSPITPLATRITYLPQTTTSLDLTTQPEGDLGEDWTLIKGVKGAPFDATLRTECQMLPYLLQKGVPQVYQAADEAQRAAATKKAKPKARAKAQVDGATKGKAPKRKRKAADTPASDSNGAQGSSSSQPAKKARKTKETAAQTDPVDFSTTKSSNPPTPKPRSRGFIIPPGFEARTSMSSQNVSKPSTPEEKVLENDPVGSLTPKPSIQSSTKPRSSGFTAPRGLEARNSDSGGNVMKSSTPQKRTIVVDLLDDDKENEEGLFVTPDQASKVARPSQDFASVESEMKASLRSVMETNEQTLVIMDQVSNDVEPIPRMIASMKQLSKVVPPPSLPLSESDYSARDIRLKRLERFGGTSSHVEIASQPRRPVQPAPATFIDLTLD